MNCERLSFCLGTDSGMTYDAPNGETMPQELIHYITKKSNLPPESSFNFGGSKVPSLAKMVFHHVKTEGECSKDTSFEKNSGKYGISRVDFASKFVILCRSKQQTVYNSESILPGFKLKMS